MPETLFERRENTCRNCRHWSGRSDQTWEDVCRKLSDYPVDFPIRPRGGLNPSGGFDIEKTVNGDAWVTLEVYTGPEWFCPCHEPRKDEVP